MMHFSPTKKSYIVSLLLTLVMFFSVLTLAAEPSSTLSFQGQLFDNNIPASGSISATFTFYDAPTSGSSTGSTINKTLTVSNGYFSTTFTPSDTTGVNFNQQLYLEVSINGTPLSPRTTINPTMSSLKTLGTFSYASAPSIQPQGNLYFNTTSNELYVSTGSSWQRAGTASSTTQWFDNGTDLYFTTGNVGIGTTTPSTKLSVAGNVTATAFYGDGSNLTGITTFSTSTTRGVFSSSATGLTYSTSTGDFSVTSGYIIPLTASTTEWSNKVSSQWTTSAGNIYFNTGNVGIGNTNPGSLLTVGNNVATIDSSGNSFFAGQTTVGSELFAQSNIRLQSTGRLYFVQNGVWQDRGSITNPSANTISINDNLLVPGNVGIGTTTPGSKLTVAGDSLFTGNVTAGGVIAPTLQGITGNAISLGGTSGSNTTISTSQSLVLNFGGSSGFDVSSGGVSVFGFLNSGGVVIGGGTGGGGTTVRLMIDSANVLAQRSGTAAQNFRVYNTFTNASNYERAVLGFSNNALNIGTENSGTGVSRNLNFLTGSSTRMVIDTAGNVGVGTGTPRTLLDVNGILTVDGNIILDPAGAGGAGQNRTINFGANFGNSALTLYDGGAGQRWGWGLNAGEMQFFAHTGAGNHFSWNRGGDLQAIGTNELMRLDVTTGNLGIGTTTPSFKLDVDGTSRFIATSTFVGPVVVSEIINNNTDIPSNFFWTNRSRKGEVLDGGSNNNVIIGNFAYDSLRAPSTNTFAAYNTAVGAYAMANANLNRQGHTAIGYGALRYTNGNNNTGVGLSAGSFAQNPGVFFGAYAGAGVSAYSQSNITAIGNSALAALTTGLGNNTALGHNSGIAVTSGAYNTVLGSLAGNTLTTGSSNIIIGYNAQATASTTSNQLNIGNVLYGNLSTGMIGIGTTTPGSTLTVVGNALFTGSLNTGAINASSLTTGAATIGGSLITNYSSGQVSIGHLTGNLATGAFNSMFFGPGAGRQATNAYHANFIGVNAGYVGTNAFSSNFIGDSAGLSAENSSYSNFVGYQAGMNATNGSNSNFIGTQAGLNSTSGSLSSFLGYRAGSGAANSANSIFIGTNAGLNDTVNNTSGNKSSILLGNYTSTGGFSNSIAIGQGTRNSAVDQLNIGNVLYATGISSSTTSSATPMANGMFGIGTSTPSAQFTTTGTVRFASLGSGGANLITDSLGNVTVSSDERLKDIQGVYESGLAQLKNIQPISYKWKTETGYDTVNSYAGFSAQNVKDNLPEAVTEDSRGFLTLADRPILAALVNAVKEVGVWFVDNGKTFFVSEDSKIDLEGKFCVDEICMTKDEFKAMMIKAKADTSSYSTPAPASTPVPTSNPVIEDTHITTEEVVVEEISTQPPVEEVVLLEPEPEREPASVPQENI